MTIKCPACRCRIDQTAGPLSEFIDRALEIKYLARLCLACYPDFVIEGDAFLIKRLKSKRHAISHRHNKQPPSLQRECELHAALSREWGDSKHFGDSKLEWELQYKGFAYAHLASALHRRRRRALGLKGRVCWVKPRSWAEQTWEKYHSIVAEYDGIPALRVTTPVSRIMVGHCKFEHSELLPSLEFRLELFKKHKKWIKLTRPRTTKHIKVKRHANTRSHS